MNNVCKIMFQICFITLLTVFSLQSVAEGATQISGKVTAKRSDSVKVEFKPHKTVGPKIGDRVDFKTMIQGVEVNAGTGEVTERGENFVWIKRTKGRPNLKMVGIIWATGTADLYQHLKSEYNKFLENHDINILTSLEKYAQNGNADAQNMVGIIYTYGNGGVKQDINKGLKWTRKAVEQNHAKAQYNLARAYSWGGILKQNDEKAVQLYRRAAEQGHLMAQYFLGAVYEYGEGVQKNKAEAIKWYRKAAAQNDSTSQEALKRLGVNE